MEKGTTKSEIERLQKELKEKANKYRKKKAKSKQKKQHAPIERKLKVA
jgi:hypothetical protein